MATEIVRNYKNLVAHIGNLIDVAGYRNDYVAKKIGISAVSFATKKKRNSFSVDEVEKIIQLIDNEDVDDYLMSKIMEDRADEPTISLADLKTQMGWK
ncbi:hypothetical protein GO730_09710 [Spirosoma sp. HMF3257]|uniref:Uncharacterized protein n=1 Tax=Spirosoma telluris TaxID=2183553 RepID=A0A327NI17_9BACT|nr:hypothetical protein [Spirosoma telluris]RAI74465.1 hypothetical protein HMF3257_09615 [Spirosoma telluris]